MEQVQKAIEFVNKPEVRTQDLRHIKKYLREQMGLTSAELFEVMRRSDLPGVDPCE